MSSRGGQPGNQNAAKSRLFENAVRRALAAEDGKSLRDAAERLLKQAASGERWAVECLRDTLDGKPRQSVELDVTNRSVVDLDDTSLAGVVAKDSGSGVTSTQDGASQPPGLH